MSMVVEKNNVKVVGVDDCVEFFDGKSLYVVIDYVDENSIECFEVELNESNDFLVSKFVRNKVVELYGDVSVIVDLKLSLDDMKYWYKEYSIDESDYLIMVEVSGL